VACWLVGGTAEGHVSFKGLLEAVSGVVGTQAFLLVLVLGVLPAVASGWKVLVRGFSIPWFADKTCDGGHGETH